MRKGVIMTMGSIKMLYIEWNYGEIVSLEKFVEYCEINQVVIIDDTKEKDMQKCASCR